MAKNTTEGRLAAQNRRARHDYFIEETFEAGLVLQGTEIKSIRKGSVSIKEAFGRVDGGEVFIDNMNISPYEQGNRYNHDPIRKRKLLLNRKQISTIIGKTQQAGYALVPLKLYIKNGYAKLLVGIGKGKKKYDKRADEKKKSAKRQMEKAVRREEKGM
ncbi:SsrA-binding protein SmpB [Tuberibacillus sp. Marseille-P3662]|uniref:SsrA-binding protein SmpB n=1 Tax=Tuberibacillus sp. Marseille-P3662 TaxID=1965358 RepID=UPI000A1C9955|nr:SsrA-binding protein SmpB [Tuberibacillus sp. Marseille-P3662]